jgi:hypothetical protein
MAKYVPEKAIIVNTGIASEGKNAEGRRTMVRKPRIMSACELRMVLIVR